jgi:hypothetical protein
MTTEMKEYRLYVLTLEGQIKKFYSLQCVDDGAAKKQAEQFVTDAPVELWEGPRRVARFSSRV